MKGSRTIGRGLAGLLALVALPAAAQELPRDGASLGGNWRAAPSVSGERLGALRAGTRLRILSNTGDSYQGFDWFAVEVDGRRGFQWGGILCADGLSVEGLTGVCPGTEAAVPAPAADAPAVPAEVRTATEALDGRWVRLAADVHGVRVGSCTRDADAALAVSGGRLAFGERTCTATGARRAADGALRLTGTCADGGALDTRVYVAEGEGLLAFVDGSGRLTVYRGCWLPE